MAPTFVEDLLLPPPPLPPLFEPPPPPPPVWDGFVRDVDELGDLAVPEDEVGKFASVATVLVGAVPPGVLVGPLSLVGPLTLLGPPWLVGPLLAVLLKIDESTVWLAELLFTDATDATDATDYISL